MNAYLAAWRAVANDLKSKVIIVPVTREMPNRPPHSVEEALLMFEVLDQRVKFLRILIEATLQVKRTSTRQRVLLALTRELLRCINFQQMYLNKATNLLVLNSYSSDPKVVELDTFLGYERKVAVKFLATLKEMSRHME
jgi:hypothetical protein